MTQKTKLLDDEKQLTLPPLRIPLSGLAALICEGLIMRRAMTVAQVQAVYIPCTLTPDEIGPEAFAKQQKSKIEATRQILFKLYRHGYIRRTRLPTDGFGRNPWLYGAPTLKAVVEVAGYYQRQLLAQEVTT